MPRRSKLEFRKLNALLVADRDFLPTLMQILNHAKTQIDLIAYSFAIGSASGQINRGTATYRIAAKLCALKAKRKSGIQIRVYLEGRRDTRERNRVTAEYLRSHGIEVKFGSTHAKGVMVDNHYVLFGSTNLTNQSIQKNNETNLVLDDVSVTQGFGEYFEHLWDGGHHGEIELAPPLLADGAFKDVLITMIDQAKKRLDFSIYFFDQVDIEQALIRAHDRGVHVRGFVHDHRSFALSYVRRTRATVKRLAKAGIDDLHFGPTTLFTHSKFLIQDLNKIALGTGNWLDEDVTTHPQLYVYFQNPKLAREMSAHLTRQMDRS